MLLRALLVVLSIVWMSSFGFVRARQVEMKPPEVGDIAPAIGEVPWLQSDGESVDVAKLRGKVVLVTSYGYYCDSCVRYGVPLAKALRIAHPEVLRVIGLTVGIGDDTTESIVSEAKKLGITYPIAQVGANGETSPYVNLGINSNLTYAFVISRAGVVTWRGDPSRDRDEYLHAVARAFDAVPVLPIAEALAPELRDAALAYAAGDLSLVEPAVQTAVKKFGAKSPKVKSDGAALLELVEGSRKALMDDLERAAGAHEPERYVRAANRVQRAFPKGPCADRLGELEMHVYMQSDIGVKCKTWSAWLELERARPAAFPQLKDKDGAKFAKSLAKYVKSGDGVGVERAKGWLDAFAHALEL